MRDKIIKIVSAWLPVILWAGIIFKLSAGAVPSISTVYIQDFLFKKGAHMFFFGIFGFLFFRALRLQGVNRKKAIIFSLIFTILYGASDEYHQSFTQVREARFRDVGFDGLGGSLAMVVVYYILPKLPKNILNIFQITP